MMILIIFQIVLFLINAKPISSKSFKSLQLQEAYPIESSIILKKIIQKNEVENRINIESIEEAQNKLIKTKQFNESLQLQDPSILMKNILSYNDRNNEINIESFQKHRLDLPQVRRFKRNPDSSTSRSRILQSICARVQTTNQFWTHGETEMDILGSQSEPSLHVIYSPCSDDIEFFDSWGG